MITEFSQQGGTMKIIGIARSFIYIVMAVLVTLTNCDREATLVARVGTKRITISEFEAEFAKGKNAEQIKKASLDAKKLFLDGMINRQLKIISAYQNRCDTIRTVIDQVKDRSRGIMFNRLVDLEVIQKIIPESALKEYYIKSNKEVKIKQIFIKFDPNLPEQKQAALNRAKEIERRAKNRESFEELAAAFSDDINTAKKGGDKGYLKWAVTSAENPLYKAAFSMSTNEISGPIETPNGYYIIKVVNIKKYQSPPYEQQRERIRKQFFSINNKKLEERYLEFLDKLRTKYQLTFKEEAIELFAHNYVTTVENNGDSLISRGVDPLDSYADDQKKQIIVGFNNGYLLISDLIAELKRYPARRRPQFKDKSDVQNFINSRLVPAYLLEQEVKARKMSKDPTVASQVTSFKENLMINEIQRLQINNKINIGEEEIRDFFEHHREDYKHPEKREVQQIFVTDKNLADDVTKWARRGINFDRLFHRYNEKESLKEKNGKLEITEGYAGIGKPAFKIGKGEVTDPIKIGDGYFVVKVLNIIEPTFRTYDESKHEVSSKVKRIAYEQREKEWIDTLRDQINYVIYEKNLAKAFTNYTAQQYVAYE